MTNYLTQVDDLLRTDGIKYPWPEGTEELYSTVANLQSIAATLGYLIHQSAATLLDTCTDSTTPRS